MEIILFGMVIILIGGFGFVMYKKNQNLTLTLNEKETLLLQKEQHIQEQNLKLNSYENQLTHYRADLEKLENEFREIQNKKEQLLLENQNHIAQISNIQTKLELQEKHILEDGEKLKNEFKNLANEILEGNSKKLSSQNKETLALILNPVKEQISEFKKKVEDVYDKEAKDRNMLAHELKTLKELNLKMSNDAINLTNALKGEKKKQGIWGEMVLEKVLENSGLREGFEYNKEVNLKDETNTNFRPDVIINLPENRHIIIDAKTSLNSYNEYMASDDEDQKALYLKAHITAIKEHIKSLANKRYENLQGINSLDFIFMFIPIEGALLLALDNDINLYDEAFKQKIILVSPTTLLVALRAVENSWRYERQAQSIADVAMRAERLYGKFVGFVEDMEKIGDYLKKTDDTYQKAFGKLSSGSGNLISQVTMLQKVSNIKPKKEIKSDLKELAMDSDNEL